MRHFQETHPVCDADECNLYFDNEEELHAHRMQDHAAAYCAPCRRIFSAPDNLDAHLNSNFHKEKTIPCAARAGPGGCDAKFVSLSAMILHLEAGVCASGTTRAIVNSYMPAVDKSRLVCVRVYIPAARGEPRWDDEAERWTCSERNCAVRTKTKEEMVPHADSAVHDSPKSTFRCAERQCDKRASTLGGIIQHIERCHRVSPSYRKAVAMIGRLERWISGP
ncbi:hypothetical protein AURDEDRAFT_146411 [Auricularia subglabra TFB-10046 SS5]|nr:hypothetical protein AURDEDRAFT_146411 [Auricularia subglabra TFB-10046 SS5]